MRMKGLVPAVAIAVLVLLAGCAALAPAPAYDALLADMMKASFRDQGIATVDRLNQDAATALGLVPKAVATRRRVLGLTAGLTRLRDPLLGRQGSAASISSDRKRRRARGPSPRRRAPSRAACS